MIAEPLVKNFGGEFGEFIEVGGFAVCCVIVVFLELVAICGAEVGFHLLELIGLGV